MARGRVDSLDFGGHGTIEFSTILFAKRRTWW